MSPVKNQLTNIGCGGGCVRCEGVQEYSVHMHHGLIVSLHKAAVKLNYKYDSTLSLSDLHVLLVILEKWQY
jgi:hypothetical protein